MGDFYVRIATPLLKGRKRSQGFLIGRRRRDAARHGALRHQDRAREAAAVRQQVGDRGRRRSAARRVAGRNGSRADGGGRAAQGPSGTDLGPVLCGHGRALQLQRPRAPLLYAQGAGDGRSRRSICCQRTSAARASHAIALDIRKRLEGLRRAGAYRDQGRRSAAGPARALDAARRSLWARRARRGAISPRKCARPSTRSISSSTSTTASVSAPSVCASRSIRKRSNITASRSARSTTRSARSSAA